MVFFKAIQHLKRTLDAKLTFTWYLNLKGSYDAISCFPLSLECLQAVCVYIRWVKLQRLKSQTQRDILYKS